MWIVSVIKEKLCKPDPILPDGLKGWNSPRQDHAYWILRFECQIKSLG